MISWNQLERRTDPLVLPVIALVVVLGLETCQKSICTFGTSHTSPTLCLHCFYGEWIALSEVERDLFRLWVSYASS
jgi:hypothetical protein